MPPIREADRDILIEWMKDRMLGFSEKQIEAFDILFGPVEQISEDLIAVALQVCICLITVNRVTYKKQNMKDND